MPEADKTHEQIDTPIHTCVPQVLPRVKLQEHYAYGI